jgi:hypothetical protein
MLLQRNFWAFGLLKLLRPLGFFSLHAAGVVSGHGRGLLINGRPGSGKSTLALGQLLAHSSPQLFDRPTMRPHLDVLQRLLQQTTAYELQAGRDLYEAPRTLVHLLREAEGAARWPDW